MPISIYSNMSSLDAQIHLGNTQMNVQKNMAHLSSGLRITSAADDAAGLGISTIFDAQIRGYSQAERNSNDGISMLQTVEGALGEINTVLERMRELAVQSANGTYAAVDRNNIVAEVGNLQSEIDRIASTTRFGNVQMLNAATTTTLQVGVMNSANDTIVMALGPSKSTDLLVDPMSLSMSSQTGAQAAISSVDTAIASVSGMRANIGALETRVGVARENDSTFRMNLSAATSRIRDVDVAAESADLARNQVLSQAGVAVLAQANQVPQLALSLLKG